VLREWVRVLKPGGVLKIATVDMDKVFDAVAAGNPDGWPIQGYLYGGQTDANDFHKSGYNDGGCEHLMTRVG
jgi:ubiquinone/menaquinone biosynthesis C-methylase UbiE